VTLAFFSLELFYHGVLDLVSPTHTMRVSIIRFIVHETTDLFCLIFYLYVLRALPYIPYYGAINIDSIDDGMDNIERERIHNVHQL
jgi:hypothetical protein